MKYTVVIKSKFISAVKDPSRKTLANELEEQENLLKQCVDKLKVVEANRVALVSQLRDALNEQVLLHCLQVSFCFLGC